MDSMRIWRESLEQNFSISMKIKIDFKQMLHQENTIHMQLRD